MGTLTGIVLVAMCIVLFFPVHAAISTSLDVVGDEDSKMRIIECTKQGMIDVTSEGIASLTTTKSVTDKSTEGAAELTANRAKLSVKTPEYYTAIAGNNISAVAVYGFSFRPKEVEGVDEQGNSTTIFSTTINEAQAAVSIDAEVLENVTLTEKISVPYKGRPLTITESTINDGGIIFNRTLELSGMDVWAGDKI